MLMKFLAGVSEQWTFKLNIQLDLVVICILSRSENIISVSHICSV